MPGPDCSGSRKQGSGSKALGNILAFTASSKARGGGPGSSPWDFCECEFSNSLGSTISEETSTRSFHTACFIASTYNHITSVPLLEATECSIAPHSWEDTWSRMQCGGEWLHSYSISPKLELIIATCSSVPLRSAKHGSQWLCLYWPTTYWNHSCILILNISAKTLWKLLTVQHNRMTFQS